MSMRRWIFLLSCGTLPLQSAFMTQNAVIIYVSERSDLSVTSNPAAMVISLDSSGYGRVIDDSTYYSVYSNKKEDEVKITGSIKRGGSMPDHTTLSVQLGSSIGTSLGLQTLTTSNVDLVTDLPAQASDTGQITYLFQVTDGWTIPAQTITRTIVFTLMEKD